MAMACTQTPGKAAPVVPASTQPVIKPGNVVAPAGGVAEAANAVAIRAAVPRSA